MAESKKTKAMTPIDWEVYKAVEASSEYGYPITQRDLCEAVGIDYLPDSRGNGNRFLWDIVKKINRSPEVDKAIYTDDYTYILADEAQFGRMVSQAKAKLSKAGKDLATLTKKRAFDGQGKIGGGFHEAYRK